MHPKHQNLNQQSCATSGGGGWRYGYGGCRSPEVTRGGKSRTSVNLMVELLDDAVRCVHRAVAADNLCEEYSSLLMCCTLLNCLQRPAGGDGVIADGS